MPLRVEGHGNRRAPRSKNCKTNPAKCFRIKPLSKNRLSLSVTELRKGPRLLGIQCLFLRRMGDQNDPHSWERSFLCQRCGTKAGFPAVLDVCPVAGALDSKLEDCRMFA
jgi:hypothetical protein